MHTDLLRAISDKAMALFSDHTAGPPKSEGDHYIRRRGNVLQWRQGLQLTKSAEQQDIHNLLFPSAAPGPLDFHIPAPCFAVLVGRYGVGKTETIRRMSDECYARAMQAAGGEAEGANRRNRSDPSGPFWPVPINLAWCRGRQKILDQIPSTPEFIEFLRGDGQLETADWQTIRAGLMAGEVCLLLDGLDEALDLHHHHKHFFFALSAFLRNARGLTVLGVRKEYLAAIDPECRELLRPFRVGQDRAMSVFSVELESFADQEVQSYLERRLGPERAKSIWRALNERVNSELKTMLYRPLHLRVFVDLAQEGNVKAEFLYSLDGRGGEHAARYKGIAALFKKYTDGALDHARVLQRSIKSTWIWDNDLLSQLAMDMYSKSRDVLHQKDIKKIRAPLEPGGGDPDEPPLLAIHKCPFLVRDITEKQARFSQRAFFEYFTVRGIVMDLEAKGWEIAKADAFNNLVVNADMRKFLRGMVPEFDEKIEYSCGLYDPQYWQFSQEEFESRKEWLRVVLVKVTYGMTNPEETDEKIEESIRQLLNEDLKGFDPGYLRYVFHAVVTYMIYENRRFDKSWKGFWQKLMEILEAQLESALKCLGSESEAEPEPAMRERYQFLIEEIVHASVTFNLDWIEDHVDALNTALDKRWEPSSKTRMTSHMQQLDRRK
jgi:hypothetical protein